MHPKGKKGDLQLRQGEKLIVLLPIVIPSVTTRAKARAREPKDGLQKRALRSPSYQVLQGHDTDDPADGFIVSLDQVLKGHRRSTLRKHHRSSKIHLGAKLGDDKSNGDTMVNVVVHDVLNLTWYVKQALHVGHSAGTDTLSHCVGLLVKLCQLRLLPCLATKSEV